MSGRVLVDVADGVATVTLDDPERRNALTAPLVAEIVAAFDRFESGDDQSGDDQSGADQSGNVRAVIVTGTPPAFCAGADLGNLGDAAEPGLRAIYEGFLRVARSPLPTIAAVNGAAVGAGMNLALCCDVRLAARSARFDTRFLQLGLHPGGGHTWMLQRAVGPQAAAAMVLFGQVLDGEAAADAGLVYRCTDDDALLSTARSMARAAADAPAPLARRVKQTLRDIAAVDQHADAVDMEIEAQLWSLQQPFFAERLAALRARISQRP
ncbi:MAG: enoyl-CoA hydratase [Acidimicrobiaceae bacterium]|nr:enoyl-CoA hydratase [Acidimicrobiaceae bacterium]